MRHNGTTKLDNTDKHASTVEIDPIPVKTRKSVHGTLIPPPIVFISPAINNVKHIFRP